MATSYSNYGGSGFRLPIIIPTCTLNYSRDILELIDGDTTGANGITLSSPESPTGKVLKFEFPEPVVIDEVTWRQSTTVLHGTWKWQGSNNDVDWYDIGGNLVLGGALTQVQTTLNGNKTAYKYYRLYGLLGSTSSGMYIYEVEFKIAPSTQAATYLCAEGYGDRTTPITTSQSGGLFNAGNVDSIINGVWDIAEAYFSSVTVTDHWMKFDFGTSKVLKEAIWFQYNTDGSGTWKWQGSDNDSDWYDIGSSFTLGGAKRQVQTQLNGNTTAYRYYRLLGVSGTTSTVWLHEIAFKVAYPANSTTTTTTTHTTSSTSTSTTTTCLYDEEFTGSDTDPPDTSRWAILAGTPDIQGNTLEMATGETVESKFVLVGDFEVEVEFNLTNDDATNTWAAGIQAIVDEPPPTNEYKWMKAWAAYENSSPKYGYQYTNGNAALQDYTATGSRTGYSSGWLRITREGAAMSAWYKQSGGSWVQVGTGRDVSGSGGGGQLPVHIRLLVETLSGAPAPVCRFDNLKITTGCPVIRAHDDTNFTNFSEYTSDQAPSDWTERWAASGDWEVRDKPTGVQYGGKVLRSLEKTNERSALSWDDLGSDVQEIEVLARFSITDDAKYNAGVVLRGSGTDGAEQGYAVTFWNDTIRYVVYYNGIQTTRSSVAKDLSDGDRVWLRAKIRGGYGEDKWINVRMWVHGTAEPTTWDVAYEESVYDLPNGWAGLFGVNNEYDCDYFAVGLGGAAAASPLATQTTTTTTSTTTVTELLETDFGEYTLAQAPSDWTARWYTTSQTRLVEACDCASDSQVPGQTRHLRHLNSAGADETLLTWDDADGAVNVDLLVLQEPETTDLDSRLYARASGAYNSENAYVLRVSSAGLSIAKFVSGVWTVLTSPVPSAYTASGQGYFLRFRVQGTSLKGKIWSSNQEEPVEWNSEVTDSDITSGGWVGIGHGQLGTNDYNYVGIGINKNVPSPRAGLVNIFGNMYMAAALSAAVNWCRAMGGTIPAGYNRKLYGFRARIPVTSNPSYYVRVGVYSGGSLSSGPAGATLLHDFGMLTTLTINAWNYRYCNPPVDIPNNAPVWLVMAGNDGHVDIYRSTDECGSGNWQQADGYWESGSMSDDERDVLPATWPTDSGGSYGTDYLAMDLILDKLGAVTTTTTTTTTHTSSTTTALDTDFSEYSVGAPGDWTERWNTGVGSLAVQTGLGWGGKNMRVYNGVTNGRYAGSWDDPGTPADVEVLTRIRPGADVEWGSRVFVRGSGGVSTESAYWVQLSTLTQTIQLWKWVSATSTGLGSKGMPLDINTWYWVRLRADGSKIKAKVWAGGYADEPGNWDIEVIDTSHANGWVGVGHYETTSDNDVDYFAVATGGGTAPYPSGGQTTTSTTTTTTTTTTTHTTTSYTTTTGTTTTVEGGEDEPGKTGTVVNIISG